MIRLESYIVLNSVVKNVDGPCYNTDLNCYFLSYRFSGRNCHSILAKIQHKLRIIKIDIAFSFLQQTGDDYVTKTKTKKKIEV